MKENDMTEKTNENVLLLEQGAADELLYSWGDIHLDDKMFVHTALEEGDKGRWFEYKTLIIGEYNKEGSFIQYWGADYNEGLTELQENEWAEWREDGKVAFRPMERKVEIKEIVSYEYKK